MANDNNDTWGQRIGFLIFIVTAGFGAMELTGFFDLGLNWDLNVYLLITFVGGAIGGMLIGRGSPLAGLVGGMLAGPCGLLAIYYWIKDRQQINTIELVIAQGIGSLPGVGVYFLLKSIFGAVFFATAPEDVAQPIDSVEPPGEDAESV